ncbi:hypothetical protein [Kibdelosporangium philippinense]|uniref:hypothetical protein n=1 Tax=Kibdelosporangium philippinense TaxID=211113 RepID=UPI00361E133F
MLAELERLTGSDWSEYVARLIKDPENGAYLQGDRTPYAEITVRRPERPLNPAVNAWPSQPPPGARAPVDRGEQSGGSSAGPSRRGQSRAQRLLSASEPADRPQIISLVQEIRASSVSLKAREPSMRK